MPEFDHLNVPNPPIARPFKSTLTPRRDPIAPRNRETHSARLLGELQVLEGIVEQLPAQRQEHGLPPRLGMTLALEIRPPGSLEFDKVEWAREGTELLSVRTGPLADIVAVYVPEGGLAAFEKRVLEYRTEDTRFHRPRHAALVDVIEHFRRAIFDELWTDETEPPTDNTERWFQLWLRQSGSAHETYAEFVQQARSIGITLDNEYLAFPARVVTAAFCTRAELEQAIDLLDRIAEIRTVRDTAEFFLSDLTPADQVLWVRNLVGRTTNDGRNVPYVTLLDTGVAHAHPLLQSALDAADMHALDPAWGAADHHDHGTEMAGVLLHGNLTGPLASAAPHAVPHRLESVKILPPTGAHPRHLYGLVTRDATGLVEAAQPQRQRTFAMMVTADGPCNGQPTEWSAMVDRLAFGANDTEPTDGRGDDVPPLTPRLFVLAGGNVQWPSWANYPTVNDVEPIQSPAQAWNALTVGAYTELIQVDRTKWPSLVPLATAGGLAPSSTTSVGWQRVWPYKPDVVAEGGNGCLDQGQPIVGPEGLQVLTTARDFTRALLTETGCTSAAAADTARLCALIAHRYPDYWPETIRALVIHGARFTGAMRQTMPFPPSKAHKATLLRRFGHGAIQSTNALVSTHMRPTLVVQSTLQPYRREKGNVQLNVLNLHELPWPTRALQALGDASVTMRVTLSYFIDPNPAMRGWLNKFRYQSHALRFAVQGATETPERFGQRINKLDRTEDENIEDPDSDGWYFGAQLRARGSLHSDIWVGTAAQLAAKSHLAVFPVGGWWKDAKDAGKHDTVVRYALVVSLDVADNIAVEVDLYTPILTQLRVPIVVEIPLA